MSGLRILLAVFLLVACASVSAASFTLTDSAGHVHHLKDYRGKWVLVNFWASWCAPCREEIPELADLYRQHKDKDLTVIGVAMEYPEPKVVLDFVKEFAMPYPIVLGDYKLARQIGEVRGLPTSFLFDPKGNLASKESGPVTQASIEAFIKSY